jgi:hypothetical protein
MLHKAHVEGKKDETTQDLETPVSLRNLRPNLKKVGPMKPLRDPPRSGKNRTHASCIGSVSMVLSKMLFCTKREITIDYLDGVY